MSNIIKSNPGIIDLRDDNSMWGSSPNYEIPGFKSSENPAILARAEYENDLYVNALADNTYKDNESIAVETAQPLSPIREGGVQVNDLERVPAAGELHGYATNEGRAIDPAEAEAALSSARETVHAALGGIEQQAATAHDMQEYAAHGAARAIAYGDNLMKIRAGVYETWQARG
jgi:hypothetical protein